MKKSMKRLGTAILSTALVFNLLAVSALAVDDDLVETRAEDVNLIDAELLDGSTDWSTNPEITWYNPGDKQKTYTLTTAAQLAGLYVILQDENFEYFEDFSGVTIKLGNDIILNDVSIENWTDSALEWHSMSGSRATNTFAGTFDGGGHSIIGLYSTEGGLFADINKATIKDLTMDSAVVTVEETINVGAIVGSASGSIENCTIKDSVVSSDGTGVGGIAGSSVQATVTNCDVVNTDIFGASSVGGISGMSGETSNCTVDGASTISGWADVGGIAGLILRSITNCTNSATVSGTTGSLGGIAGGYPGGTSVKLEACTNNGAVGGEEAWHVGGILGSTSSYDLTISDCINNAPVSGSTNVAGIAGLIYTNITIEDCESNGPVSGQKNVAGVVGNSSLNGNPYEAGKPNSITGCTVSAEISGNENVGGLVGSNIVTDEDAYDDTTIKNNILTTSASVDGKTNVGALIGSNGTDTDTGTVENNFWPETAGTKASGGGAGSDEESDTAIITSNSSYKPDGTLNTPISNAEGGATISNLGDAIDKIIGGGDIPDVLKMTVTYNKNGHGTAPSIQTVSMGKTVALPSMENDGYYTFTGWSDGSGSYKAGTIVTVMQDTTFTAQWRNDTPSSNSGSGGSSDPSYTVSVPSSSSIKNGSLSVSPRYAEKGDTVTITVKPDEGYELDELIVTDKNGDELKLTDKGDGKYAFTMPGSKVEIEVSFVKIEEEPAPSTGFIDVSTDVYYAEAVAWAVENGITTGTGDGTTFSPDTSCTRAQMMTFLWRAAGSPKATGTNPFTDLDTSAYYYDAVLWAVDNGITTGTSATTFSPDVTVTRAQTVTFLYRNAGSPTSGGSSFADVSADAYYTNAVAWAASEGITTGTGNNQFSPDADCTRAQIVTFLWRDMA